MSVCLSVGGWVGVVCVYVCVCVCTYVCVIHKPWLRGVFHSQFQSQENICNLILQNRRYTHIYQNSFYWFFYCLQSQRNGLAKFLLHKLSSVGNTAVDSRTSK